MLFHKAREKGLARLLICRKELSISFVKICSINFVSLGLHSNAVVMFTPACPAAAAAAAGPLRHADAGDVSIPVSVMWLLYTVSVHGARADPGFGFGGAKSSAAGARI